MQKFLLVIFVCCALAQPGWDPRQTDNIPSYDAMDILPGIESMGLGAGFDIVTEKLSAPVADWTFQYENMVHDPYIGKWFKYPDQVSALTTDLRLVQTANISTYEDFHSMAEDKSKNFGLSVGVGYAGLSVGVGYSQSRGQSNALTKGNTRNLAQTNVFVQTYYMNLGSRMKAANAGQAFQALIQSLPSTYDAAQYAQVITYFGTHYVHAATMGGKMNVTTVYDKSLAYTKTGSWIQHEVGLAISYKCIKLGIDIGFGHGDEKQNEAYKAQSETIEEAVGGDPGVLATQGFKKWAETVPRNPVLIPDKTTLRPISDLIADPKKKEIFRQLAAKYIATGKFE